MTEIYSIYPLELRGFFTLNRLYQIVYQSLKLFSDIITEQ